MRNDWSGTTFPHPPRRWPVLRAARIHWRLANRYADVDLRAALGDARHMLVYWAHAEQREAAAILRAGLHAHVSAYPEVISIAATLLTARPQIEQPDGSTSSASALLIVRIGERTTTHHYDDTPVEQWVQNRRQVSKLLLTVSRDDEHEVVNRH